jgi:hypothetical protein
MSRATTTAPPSSATSGSRCGTRPGPWPLAPGVFRYGARGTRTVDLGRAHRRVQPPSLVPLRAADRAPPGPTGRRSGAVRAGARPRAPPYLDAGQAHPVAPPSRHGQPVRRPRPVPDRPPDPALGGTPGRARRGGGRGASWTAAILRSYAGLSTTCSRRRPAPLSRSRASRSRRREPERFVRAIQTAAELFRSYRRSRLRCPTEPDHQRPALPRPRLANRPELRRLNRPRVSAQGSLHLSAGQRTCPP